MNDYIFLLLISQVILSIFIIIVILLQPNSSDGITNFSTNNSMLGFANKVSGNSFLAKLTKWLALILVINSLTFSYFSYQQKKENNIENINNNEVSLPVEGKQKLDSNEISVPIENKQELDANNIIDKQDIKSNELSVPLEGQENIINNNSGN